MFCSVEHEKSFITSGPGLVIYIFVSFILVSWDSHFNVSALHVVSSLFLCVYLWLRCDVTLSGCHVLVCFPCVCSYLTMDSSED